MKQETHSPSPGGRHGPNNNINSRDIPLQETFKRHFTATRQNLHRKHEEENDELDPESDTALLRRHYRENSDSEDDYVQRGGRDPNSLQPLGPLQRLFGFMSKTPLLLRSAPGFGTGSYGAAPLITTDGSEDDDNEIEGVRRRHRRREAGSKLRNALSVGSALGRTKADRSASRSTHKSRRESDAHIHGRDAGAKGALNDDGLEGRFGAGAIPIPNSKLDGASEDHHHDELSSDELDEAETEEDEDYSTDEEDPHDNSPYPQVRASVSAIDNTSLSINTPRMWALSLFFAFLGSATNLFFSLRYPSVSITPVIALLLVHPLGHIWDRVFKRADDPEEVFIDGAKVYTPLELDPNNHIDIPEGGIPPVIKSSRARRARLWLAQGRWNEKEHSCVYISSNVSFGFAFATDVIVEQVKFYNQEASITYQLLLILSTQILGYTFAGLARRFLVRPGGMIWPGTLMSAAMFTTLHKEENKVANGWRISRWKFFFIVWLSSFLFYFLPGLLMPALSYFSVITWFAPKNVIVANLFGVASGLGLFPVTFDWAQIAYIGSPLLTPFWAAMNVVGGLVIVMWIIAPIAYYSNIFNSSYMPILSSSVFDNTGNIYNVTRILTPDFLFDKVAYDDYSKVYLPITYVLSYGLQFAALASLLSHTTCWHGKDIWKQWKTSLNEVKDESKASYEAIPSSSGVSGNEEPTATRRGKKRLERSDSHMDNIITQEDVHNRLMRRYKDAPLSWYLVTFVTMTAVGIFVCE